MRITIQGSQLDLTPAVKEYIEMKIKPLEKFVARYEENSEVTVRFKLARTTRHHHKGDVYRAEADVHLPGKDIRADHEADDARAAIDAVKDTLKHDLVKFKEKMIDQKKRG